MTNRLLYAWVVLSILFSTSSAAAAPSSPILSPIANTSGSDAQIEKPSSQAALPNYRSFISDLKSGRPELAGVYVRGLFAYKVIQQPSNNPAYVSTQADALTQFSLASNYRTIGLLGHNNLAGSSFFNLAKNQDIILVNGDGSTSFYQVYDIQRYRALSPESPYSQFIDLATNERLSAEQLFNNVYGKGNILVFQTCIAVEDVPSWGRIFVLARPVNHLTPTFDQLTPAVGSALGSIRLIIQPTNKFSIPRFVKFGVSRVY